MSTPAIYDSAAIYIGSAADAAERIQRIQSVIYALEDVALKAAETGNFDEYSLDDGQTKIRTKYRDVSQIAAAISAFEKQKQKYINRLNGRITRLVDGKNFIKYQ